MMTKQKLFFSPRHLDPFQFQNQPPFPSVEQISFSPSARNLGFYITEHMSVDLQIKTICRSVYCELRRIWTIHHYLSVDATKVLVSAFVLSKLDYCNSLLIGSPSYLLEKLQKVQNFSCKTGVQGKGTRPCETSSSIPTLAANHCTHRI